MLIKQNREDEQLRVVWAEVTFFSLIIFKAFFLDKLMSQHILRGFPRCPQLEHPPWVPTEQREHPAGRKD